MPGRTIMFVVQSRDRVSQFLDSVDGFSSMKEEWATMLANNTRPTQPDIDEAFGTKADGTPIMLLPDYIAGVTAMLALCNTAHLPANANPIYKIRR